MIRSDQPTLVGWIFCGVMCSGGWLAGLFVRIASQVLGIEMDMYARQRRNGEAWPFLSRFSKLCLGG